MARPLLIALATLALTPTFAAQAAPPKVGILPSGVALPYPTDHVFRGFGACRDRAGRHRHAALDLGGVGPDAGLGTVVRAMARARIIMIGLGAERPKEFGLPDRRKGRARRKGHHSLPRSELVPGYGEVFFFTALQGRWRSGNIVVMQVDGDGPLTGATVRYLHLAAVRPDLKVGDVVEPGDEVGLLGGTGVQSAAPHVHIDIVGSGGLPIDVAALLGLRPSARCGAPAARAALDRAMFADADQRGAAWRPLVWSGPLGVMLLGPPVPPRTAARP
ncbi:MAG: peptidoglycan DD-metalloendopeptidase family protein [Myxococcota bacterium]